MTLDKGLQQNPSLKNKDEGRRRKDEEFVPPSAFILLPSKKGPPGDEPEGRGDAVVAVSKIDQAIQPPQKPGGKGN